MLVYQLKRLLAGLVVVALFAGCNSEHAFDFSRLHDIEAEGTWGLPLMNADYTIGDILSLADNPELIQVGNDGTLEIHYEYEVDSVVSASKYLDSYFNNPIEVSGSASFPSMDLPIPSGNMQVLYRDTIPVAFPSDLVVINRADLKSGLITFNITYNVDRQVHVVATCPQIVNASGQPLRVDEISSNGTLHNTYDLSGYSLVLSNNSLEVYLEVSCPLSGAPLPSELSFSYNLSLSQILFSEIRGSFAPLSVPIDNEWDFELDFLKNHLSGSLTLLNPQIKCEIMNTFPVDGVIELEKAEFSGVGVQSSLLRTTPATIYVPGATSQFTPVDLPLATSIMLSPNFEHFKLKGDAVINPNGIGSELVLSENQLIHLRFTVVLPLHLTTDNIVFRDTIPIGNIDIPDEPAFSNLFVRLGINNGIPLNFGMQVYFYDSQTQTVKDSLFMNPQIISSGTEEHPRESELFASREDLRAVQEMLSCDNIILRATVYNDNAPVYIKSDQKLGVQLSVKFNMDVNALVNHEP